MAAPVGKSRSNRRPASPEEHRRYIAEAAEAGRQLAQNPMSERQARAYVRVFQAQLLPPNRPRRWQKKKLTRACEDYQRGMRGIELFSKHIPRWSRLGYYERTVKSERLLKSIKRRQSREKRAATKQAGLPATKHLLE
jgi:hypothetical protein